MSGYHISVDFVVAQTKLTLQRGFVAVRHDDLVPVLLLKIGGKVNWKFYSN